MKLRPIPKVTDSIPSPRITGLSNKEVKSIIRINTLKADADEIITDKMMNQPIPLVKQERAQLSKLVDDDFPFDESQLEAIRGLAAEKHACLTGAAGTGKTTSLKAVVDRIVDQLPAIDMSTYFKRGIEPDPEDPDDSYEIPEKLIPGVALVAYTGRASQMIKRNFPEDWHGNIMTIHRLLAYVPEFSEEYDHEAGNMKKTMRFVPSYTADNKLPWKVIIIDEAGMLGMELWENLLAACKDDTRIIMIGDINQLPPTHGRSIFGFAMARWPSWELTHIHRQKGTNNSIVDNAWRIIHGEYPVSDDPSDPDWKFVMMPVSPDSALASKQLRKWLDTIKGQVYDPIRDTVITPINAYEDTAGFQLGQDPLNRELAMMFNSNHGRYIIDTGRDRKYFAVGDKVMATRNDHEAGITNGMTGIITGIVENGEYRGNSFRYGLVDEVNKYLADELEFEDDDEFSLDDLSLMIDAEPKDVKESKDRGPASHSVTIDFGGDGIKLERTFSTLAEVNTLMIAYVVTCHKMQGGEAPFVVVICHQAHKRMLHREWLYTAVTRASGKCVLLYTQNGLSNALHKQKIKGTNLKQKVESFNKLIDTKGLFGAAMQIKLPEPKRIEL